MGDRTESKHFAHDPETGVRWYIGPSDPPTSEQWDAYLASAPDEATRAEWAKHRPEGV